MTRLYFYLFHSMRCLLIVFYTCRIPGFNSYRCEEVANKQEFLLCTIPLSFFLNSMWQIASMSSSPAEFVSCLKSI
jgi:hypothetical protein